MLDARCRPISHWPGPRRSTHIRSPFRVGWSATMTLLERELRHLRSRDVVIEIDLDEADIRLDGWPRASARPRSPAVILSFYSTKLSQPLRYPCDRFASWEDNLRGIALALEALRKVDRYGVTRHGEQYRGWKALPAETTETFDANAAAQIIAVYTDDLPEALLHDANRAESAARSALKVTHPDVGGSVEAFHRVQIARQVLVAHHG